MKPGSLTLETHLDRDPRLDGWSVHGLGRYSHPTEAWVRQFLSIEFAIDLPDYLADMFDRARACIVYGCYHYPLLTLGYEELLRFNESALREAAKEAGASKSVQKKRYAEFINWAHDNGYLTDDARNRWQAGRGLRNSSSHKTRQMLFGPNDALCQLTITVELTEDLLRRVRSTI